MQIVFNVHNPVKLKILTVNPYMIVRRYFATFLPIMYFTL